jgi:hypothetical protein
MSRRAGYVVPTKRGCPLCSSDIVAERKSGAHAWTTRRGYLCGTKTTIWSGGEVQHVQGDVCVLVAAGDLRRRSDNHYADVELD